MQTNYSRRRDQPDTDTATVIIRRARASEAFRDAMNATRVVLDTFVDLDLRPLGGEAQIALLRERGGWSAIVDAAFRAAAGNTNFPASFGSRVQLTAAIQPTEIVALRTRAQRRLRGDA